ncbi:Tyrosine--tRNA ligase 1, cytoplasmic [Seminavis robusta]|uniref:tyrosine--tRNA ligase n=1 Tax=Seminavis robusta TaxID=568900 RepID=A0A9N8DW15_9STRA|nr:Tyrosine--tRNA ligase 1, cytoplasmic [Seminavis robusta]|eukprot:Sro323_g117370.1 Tyrosine--tRNA ligase 1, cytoplasmic (744) ;mRNA; r:56459-58855
MTKNEGGGKKAPQPKRPWNDDLQIDFDRIRSVGEECISEAELKELLISRGRGAEGPGFVLYDGFEPSGRMHIAQGVFKAMNVNKCTAPGTNGTFVFWVADWFALMNDKMGGDLAKIRVVGNYLIEVWKAAGMDLSNVVFKWASEEITEQADKYWPTMLDVARRFNITRVKKCCQIMGRLEGSLTAAQILYPLMQCTDVFFLKANICQLGVDQRKVNMLAREYCDAAGIKHKPIILSHHMLFGLKAGQEKMSKSDPDSAIFMEDAAVDVERKINNAYCPSKPEEPKKPASGDADTPIDAGLQSMHLVEDTLKNPCLDYIGNIIFSAPGASFSAGSKTFQDFESVKKAFLDAEISEAELKKGLIDSLNELLEPVRNHFADDPTAKELLAQVRQFKKEATTATKDSKVRRLNLVEEGKVPAGAHLVFAGMPTANPTLQEAVDIIMQLRTANGKPCVLFLSDWTARVCNACNGEIKSIESYHVILLAALKALDAALMETVKVIYQSEAILANPSDYWISVINVGRHFMLNDVMGEDTVDADGAGVVVGRLMKVADVLGVSPASLSLKKSLASQAEGALVERFFAEKLPESMVGPSVSMFAPKPIRLQAERESDAYKTENDEYFLLDDPKVHGKSKMKKAFCEPGNITFCPPIAVASVFAFELGSMGSITVKRSDDNGGDITFSSSEEISSCFGDGSLHPGDLKAAASSIIVEALDKLASGLKSDGEASKAAKGLKAFQKKMAKKGKK